MTTMSKEAFAKRLTTLREKAKLSKYALAKRIGLSRQAVFLIEKGIHKPTWTTVQLLALALGVDYAALAEPDLKLPNVAPVGPRGRPKKAAGRREE
jgi:DNA-binding XRE family transcriptional regulator